MLAKHGAKATKNLALERVLDYTKHKKRRLRREE